MEEQYIVLRDLRRAAKRQPPQITVGRGVDIGVRTFDTRGAEDEPPQPKIEVERLTRDDVVELRRDDQVRGLATSMPLALIKPVPRTADSDADPGWGIRAVRADKSKLTGEGVVVAVLDTGIDSKHQAFTGVDLTVKDFTGTGKTDDVGHGTHCAGTIFGRNVGDERIGVARGVTKALIGKVLTKSEGRSEMLYDGLQWATDNGANIVSMSLGFDFAGKVKELVNDFGYAVEAATSATLESYRANLNLFDELMDLIQAKDFLGRRTLVIAASGNESKRPNYAVSAALPAAADGVISVGGVERRGSKYGIAYFSNSNPKLCAPGVGITSAKVGGGLRADDGTSMACPHVAGVAALWWQQLQEQDGEVEPAMVQSKLLASARANVFVKDTNRDDRGAGLVTAP